MPGRATPARPGEEIRFTTKQALAVVIAATDGPADLRAVVSGLEQLRLLARKARAAGLDLEGFRRLLASIQEADRLAVAAREARSVCGRLLRRSGPLAAAVADSPVPPRNDPSPNPHEIPSS